MNKTYVDESYIRNTENDLNEIKYHLANIKLWSKQLEAMNNGIIQEDLTKAKQLQDKIQDAEMKLNTIKIYIDQLDAESAELIRLRYYTLDKKNMSFEKIGMRMHYVKSKIKKMNDIATKTIAYYKYQEVGDARYSKCV